jgi:hypothetical protein
MPSFSSLPYEIPRDIPISHFLAGGGDPLVTLSHPPDPWATFLTCCPPQQAHTHTHTPIKRRALTGTTRKECP